MASRVIFYIAIVLFLGSVVGYGVYLNNMIKNKERLDQNIIFTKKMPVLGGFSIGLALSIELFTVAFYIDPYTNHYLTLKGLDINPFHQFLAYFFGILLALSIAVFLTATFFKLFFEDKFDEKFKKIIKIVKYASIPAMVVFFLIMSEGNAPYLEYPLVNMVYIGKHGIAFINSYTRPAPFYTADGKLDGGLSLALYAVFILSGALFDLAFCNYNLYKTYGHKSMVTTCFFVAFPSGIVGARLWYVLLDVSKNPSSQFISNPMSIFYIWEGGLGIMGGAILGIIAGVALMLVLKYWKKDPRYTDVSYFRVVDLCVPTILIAQAVGRIGNFFNAEVHGNAISYDALMWLPTFVRNNYQFDNGKAIWEIAGLNASQAFLPLSTIESITNLAGFFFIYFGIYKGLHQKHIPGSCAGWYLVWYGLTRVFLEPLRFKTYEYSMSFISAFVMIGIGVILIVIFALLESMRKRKWGLYKNRDPHIDAVLIDYTAPNKVILRNFIIVASVGVVALATLLIIFGVLIWPGMF